MLELHMQGQVGYQLDGRPWLLLCYLLLEVMNMKFDTRRVIQYAKALFAGGFIVCALLLAPLGPVSVFCSSLVFTIELFTRDEISRIEDEIKGLGCGCVL
jgi:hypothetical protein